MNDRPHPPVRDLHTIEGVYQAIEDCLEYGACMVKDDISGDYIPRCVYSDDKGGRCIAGRFMTESQLAIALRTSFGTNRLINDFLEFKVWTPHTIMLRELQHWHDQILRTPNGQTEDQLRQFAYSIVQNLHPHDGG